MQPAGGTGETGIASNALYRGLEWTEPERTFFLATTGLVNAYGIYAAA